MGTSTKERTGPAREARERATWVCDNCAGRTTGPRKRCADCGTLRY